jgi:hypothetical protein
MSMINGFDSGGAVAGLLALPKMYFPSSFSILSLLWIGIAIISVVLVRVIAFVRSG